MIFKTVLQTKFCILLALAFVGCDGTAQTENENHKRAQDTTEVKKTDSIPNPTSIISTKASETLGIGHKEIRRILGSDIGEMQFDTKAANDFRTYMSNTLLTTSTNSYNQGYGNSDYSAGSGSIQFCENGTFVEVLSGQISVSTKGMDISSSDASYMPGYWEVALLPNGTHIILIYSTHPRMLEDSSNGFLPWIVLKYGEDFVSAPNGDLYRRKANSYCN